MTTRGWAAMPKRLHPGWEECGFYIESHPELTCIATVVKGEVILTREGIEHQGVQKRSDPCSSDPSRACGTQGQSSEAEASMCRCHMENGVRVICPGCAERQLLMALDTTPNTPLASEERMALSEAVNTWLARLSQAMLQKGSAPVEMTAKLAAPLPPALPPHITALGEQRQLVADHGRHWIGCARATPEELSSLKGVVIYDEVVSCFLSEDEAREAFVTLGWLLVQLSSLHVGDAQAGEEPR